MPSFQELNRLAAAYHEAGHAVMSWRGGLEVCERGIEANDSEQCCHVRPHLYPDYLGVLEEEFSKNETAHSQFLRQIRADVATHLGGPVAERIYLYRGAGLRSVKFNDLPEPKNYAEWVSDAELNYELGEGWDDVSSACRVLYKLQDPLRLRPEVKRVSRLLRYPRTWAAVEALAQPLYQTGSLSMDEANAILESAAPPQERIWGFGLRALRSRAKRRTPRTADRCGRDSLGTVVL